MESIVDCLRDRADAILIWCGNHSEKPNSSPALTDAERTPQTHTTPGEGSVPGEGTVGERLVERLLITQAMLGDNKKLRAENATLREAIRRLADQDATVSVQRGNVIVTLDATLTDEERAAVETAMDGYIAWMEDNAALETPRVQAKLCTLRELLERLS